MGAGLGVKYSDSMGQSFIDVAHIWNITEPVHPPTRPHTLSMVRKAIMSPSQSTKWFERSHCGRQANACLNINLMHEAAPEMILHQQHIQFGF